MRLAFLMERQYAPYAKWLGPAFARLACAPRLTPSAPRRAQGRDLAGARPPPRGGLRERGRAAQRAGRHAAAGHAIRPALPGTAVPRHHRRALHGRARRADPRRAAAPPRAARPRRHRQHRPLDRFDRRPRRRRGAPRISASTGMRSTPRERRRHDPNRCAVSPGSGARNRGAPACPPLALTSGGGELEQDGPAQRVALSRPRRPLHQEHRRVQVACDGVRRGTAAGRACSATATL